MRIVLKRVHKNFGPEREIAALADVNVTIEDGEIVSVLGPTGSGKSTLLALIAGFEFPDSGEVFVDSKKVLGLSRKRAFIADDGALFPWLSTLGNVELALKAAGVPAGERRARALEALREVELEPAAEAYPHQLSPAQTRRAALARALASKPGILLMDDPFGTFDGPLRERLAAEIREIVRRKKITTIFATRDAREAALVADRVHEMGA